MATKKATKKETPIDRRETFVSIQKNFADPENVKEKLETLYNLQQADIKIDKIHQLRGELPIEVADLEKEIAEIEGKINAVKARIENNETVITENKNLIVEYDQTIAKYNAQLETISNNREYDSLNKEIENLDLLRRISEKHIGEAKDDLVKDNEILGRHTEKLAVRNEDLEVKKQELATIVESTAKEEEVLLADRAVFAGKIDERTLAAYESIRASYNNHLAVVPVYTETSCGGCLNQIPPQRLIEIRSNKKMIICEFCGRILVNPENFQ